MVGDVTPVSGAVQTDSAMSGDSLTLWGVDEDPPRRRMTDKDRRRWPDERLDDMRTDVDDVENQVQALRLLPERVKGLREVVAALDESIGTQGQRTTDLRADVRSLQTSVREIRRELRALTELVATRFDDVDVAHDRTEKRAQGVDPDTGERVKTQWAEVFKTIVLPAAAGVGVPIAVVLLATG